MLSLYARAFGARELLRQLPPYNPILHSETPALLGRGFIILGRNAQEKTDSLSDKPSVNMRWIYFTYTLGNLWPNAQQIS